MPKEIKYLINGYQQFRKEYFSGNNDTYKELVKFGQNPRALVIACSDSRVDPAIVMSCKPGDLFVIRNVANLVPPFEEDDTTYHGTSAALEFGVCGLGIKHLVIFGHSQCGGIQSLVAQKPTADSAKSFISKWMEIAKGAYEQTVAHPTAMSLEEKVHCCSQHAIMHSLINLYTFPWIKERVASGSLFLHGWYFDLSTGLIYRFDEEKREFVELVDEEKD